VGHEIAYCGHDANLLCMVLKLLPNMIAKHYYYGILRDNGAVTHCTTSLPVPPTQNGRRTSGRFRPITLPSELNRTPFSTSAIMSLGMAAAVPFSVCANRIPEWDGGVDEEGR